MPGPTFHTNPVFLSELLKRCHDGHLQLPDFQRSWVWDEDRIKSLIASISRAFPVGALMTLDTGGVAFKPRPIEGAPSRIRPEAAQALLLDGQQRMTSMYQVTLRGEIVRTITAKRKPAERWFYIDIRKSIDPGANREEAVVAVSKDRRYSDAEGTVYDLSKPEAEFDSLLFPLTQVFSWNDWQMRLMTYAIAAGRQAALWPTIIRFHDEVIKNFEQYRVPVIALSAETSKEAVCTVFEKVNTGGKPLDAFELVTAMYAADGYELRKDWYGKGADKGRHHRFREALPHGGQERGVLAEVANTDFLQAVSLFHTRQRRREAAASGRTGKELPAVLATRAALLDLPLDAYRLYQERVEQGFVRAAKFLHRLHVYRVFDLPYQSQVVPLAAVLADFEHALDHQGHFAKLAQWYWCGVFGELYGSATESRIARDFLEVPAWLAGGELPSTVREATFRAERLKTMRMRLSAAYKGMNALLMEEGARDWRSGLPFDQASFFGEAVDIHHIFPRAWCQARGIRPERFDSIINKTPLAALTNKIIGGAAPSAYLHRLESGGNGVPPIAPGTLDGYLVSHRIAPHLLRTDDFDGFMANRQASLLNLIEAAMGKAAHQDAAAPVDDAEFDEEAVEAGFVMEAAA